jgi:fumarate reductase subunit C
MSELASASTTSEPSRPGRYRPPVSRLWWVRRRSYVLFVLRELSSVFVAWFVVYLLLLVSAVREGSDSYREFLALSGQPWMLALNVVALAFVLLHAITWFNLAPQAIVVHIGGRRLPARAVAAAHFGAWAVLSAIIAWILVGAR